MQVSQLMVFREQCVLIAVLGHIQIREMRHVVIAMRAIGVWPTQRQHRVVVSALQVTTVAFLRRQQLRLNAPLDTTVHWVQVPQYRVASVTTVYYAQVLQRHALRVTLALQQRSRYQHAVVLVRHLVITVLLVAQT